MKKWFIVRCRVKGEYIVQDEKSNLFRQMGSLNGTLGSISRGYDTEDELRSMESIPKEPCKKCGCQFSTSFRNGSELRERGLCFHCNFWTEKLGVKNKVIVEGVMYVVGPELGNNTMGFRGHGGREFKIKILESGNEIVTKNLWCSGEIPKHFREELKDNAIFI